MLFLDFTGTLHHWLGWMAKVQFLPAILAVNAAVVIILVVLTVVFGRIYCSIICPLGVFQDVIAWMGKHGKPIHTVIPKQKHTEIYRIGYFRCRLIGRCQLRRGFVGALLFHGRIAGLFQPIYEYGNNLLAAIAAHIDSYAFYSTDVWIRTYLHLSLPL